MKFKLERQNLELVMLTQIERYDAEQLDRELFFAREKQHN